ncbi:MAG: copper homeostasis periplasmic binding protein CopC [Pigmentiphaga sp.]|uniref:Copper resistance system chaperone CopC n=1 Tax=Pigmentiphaga daeguensis TaxID=414049 RepID=A0ABN1BX60_9BURK
MSNARTVLNAAVLTAGLLAAAAAQAHPELLSSTPGDKAETTAPARIELRFSEALVTQFSGARLLMTGMAGMSHAPMPVEARVSGDADPKTMLITPAKPLAAGTYRVEWRAVSSDTHPMTGNFSFSVK